MRSTTDTIRLTTSWPELDDALGGGLPLGRIVEIAGTDPEANRTMALRLAAAAQRQDLVVTYVDREQALDVGRARDLGVSVVDMLVSQPDTAVRALEIIETLVRTSAIGLMIVDSIAGFTMGVEEREDFSALGSIRVMATALRKLAALGDHDCMIVFLGHTPARKPLGPGAIHPPSSPASNGLRYYASVRMLVSRASATANLATVKVLKNKFSTNIFAEVTLRGFFDAKAHLRATVERLADVENFPNLDDAFIESQAGVLGVEAGELWRRIIMRRELASTVQGLMLDAAQRDTEEMIVFEGNR